MPRPKSYSMSELKLFPTPAEEMDLQILRSKVTTLYSNAFKRIQVEISDKGPQAKDEIFDICSDTLHEAAQLAITHKEKWEDK